MKILVSGFEAFGGETVNPTERLIDELRAGRIASPAGVVVETVLLPVSFRNSFEVLKKSIIDFAPDAVLSLGQAGGSSSIALERVAINLIDAKSPDNNGLQPNDEPISKDGRAAYFSTLPIRRCLGNLTAQGLSAELSNTAGLYVCNFLFYRLQELAESRATTIKQSGFIHFPYLPEQVVTKAKMPSMEFAAMKRALEILLVTVAMAAPSTPATKTGR